MTDPFEAGKVWFLYSRLEREFIDTTSYVALDSAHNSVWSEKFAEILTRTGDLVDSFFRLMINSKSLDNVTLVKSLRAKIAQHQKKDPKWFPTISDFRTLDSIFRFSNVEIYADYGLTHYGTLCPFKDFDKQGPSWWESYNKVKHEVFEQIEKKATLENTINALASLFILNILHKESQLYLIFYTDIISGKYCTKEEIEKALHVSFIGLPFNMPGYTFYARTPLFTHMFRHDPDPNKKVV